MRSTDYHHSLHHMAVLHIPSELVLYVQYVSMIVLQQTITSLPFLLTKHSEAQQKPQY
jgi:hypothetical protein